MSSNSNVDVRFKFKIKSMEHKVFFTQQDNFVNIIKRHLPNLDASTIKHIKTGWTNIVIEARDNKDTYFFRFPRNQFFARMMLKDFAFCSFMRDKVTFQFPNLKVFKDNERPFSMHKKIKGWSLTERLKHLSRQAATNLAYDVAKFIQELNAINPQSLPKACNVYLSTFLDELSKVDDNTYDLRQHDALRSYEKEAHVVHGDLNPGNILLDENDKMIGIIDFAFAGVSNNHVDIARIIGRTGDSFTEAIIKAYQDTTGKQVNKKHVQKLIQTWNYVEQQYILYIKNQHPDIILPS
ncbi:MAG: aminoglycoside phosphotransferase family protein [Puniceicoccales bacterium]|nr:aminoglycoside phosphotransferase family protein [Puniceicoccales bacterium]